MKLTKLVAILMVALTIVSCSKEDETIIPNTTNNANTLNKAHELSNDTHIVEVYTSSGKTIQGYNDITLKIKDKQTNKYVSDADVSWKPIMHMVNMTAMRTTEMDPMDNHEHASEEPTTHDHMDSAMHHSCPKSMVKQNTTDPSLYEGFIIFQMAEFDSSYWELQVDYTIGSMSYTVKQKISVPSVAKRNVVVFTGSDEVRYIVALVPTTPQVALNTLNAYVYKMQDMMTFPMVDGYTIAVNPRMPSMGNHTSPNNVDFTQAAAGGVYTGKLAFTMTGYWKINLKLMDDKGTVLKGESIEGGVESSSIFFEVEF